MLALLFFAFSPLLPAHADIPLDAPWKIQAHEFAEQNVKHPSWGLAHSERNYKNTLLLAAQEAVTVDLDVLFASAFLHDLGGLGSFQRKGVDHAVRSVELAEPLLRGWGFPMEKWPAVKEMILGHTYYGAPPASASARLFRDADLLDFLGSLGVARILAVTQESERPMKLPEAFALSRKFADELPAKLLTGAARAAAVERVREMKSFFDAVQLESFNGESL